MSKQRYVQDSFWTDPYIEELSIQEKLVFLYLLTNPLCNVAGIYEITQSRLSLETGIEKKQIEKILNKFCKDNKIIRHDNWILIISFGKHQSINPNIEKGVQRIIKALPDKIKALKGFERLSYFTLLNLTYQIPAKAGGNNKPMYQEPTIHLDEEGEEIQVAPPKSGAFGKYTRLVAKHYASKHNKNVTGQTMSEAKQLLTHLSEEYPDKTNEELFEEAKASINLIEKYYQSKKNVEDWGLLKVIENLNKVL